MVRLIALALTISVGTTIAAALGAWVVSDRALVAQCASGLRQVETWGCSPTRRASRSIALLCAGRKACAIHKGNAQGGRPMRAHPR